jgi:hypothetical protein
MKYIKFVVNIILCNFVYYYLYNNLENNNNNNNIILEKNSNIERRVKSINCLSKLKQNKNKYPNNICTFK